MLGSIVSPLVGIDESTAVPMGAILFFTSVLGAASFFKLTKPQGVQWKADIVIGEGRKPSFGKQHEEICKISSNDIPISVTKCTKVVNGNADKKIIIVMLSLVLITIMPASKPAEQDLRVKSEQGATHKKVIFLMVDSLMAQAIDKGISQNSAHHTVFD